MTSKVLKGSKTPNATVTKTTFSQTERTDNLLHMCSSNFNDQLPLSVYTKKPPSQSKTNELFAYFTFRGRVWLLKDDDRANIFA